MLYYNHSMECWVLALFIAISMFMMVTDSFYPFMKQIRVLFIKCVSSAYNN